MADPRALANASLERLDELASSMERRWGVGRLPKLVDAALAVRFASQRDRLDEAIRIDDPAAVAVQAEATIRAWRALDADATKAGWTHLDASIWEATLPESGEVIAIVRDTAEASKVAKSRVGKATVWTLAEVAVAIEAFGAAVRATKAAFPGAEVKAVRPASLNIGAVEQKPAQDGRWQGRRYPPSRKAISAASGFHAPPGVDPKTRHKPVAPSNLPPGFWERGDDVPF